MTKRRIFCFGMVLFSVFAFFHSALASEQASSFGPVRVVRQGAEKDFPGVLSDSFVGSTYQLYRVDGVNTSYEGFGSRGSYRLDICINESGIMWDGFLCFNFIDAHPGETTISNLLSNASFQIGDLNSTTHYYQMPYNIRIEDATSDTYSTLHYRRVSVNQPTVSPSTVKVGDTFIVSWSADWVTRPYDLFWSGGAGSGSETTTNTSKTFTAQSAGSFNFTVKAWGPGDNNPTMDEKSVSLTIQPNILLCQDPTATNYDGPLPCTYLQPTGTIKANGGVSSWSCTKNTDSANPNCDVALDYRTTNATFASIDKDDAFWYSIPGNVLPAGSHTDPNPTVGSHEYLLHGGNSAYPDGTFARVTVTILTSSGSGSHNLSINKLGTGSGTITSSPASINCGSTCNATFNNGTTVALTASPDTGSTFAGWSGDADCSDGQLTMNSDKTCTATFNIAPSNTHNLTVNKNGTGSGTITSSPASINCGSTCNATFNNGTTVALTASPDTGSTFAGWSGDADCSDGQLTMNSDKTCTATFNTNPPPPGTDVDGWLDGASDCTVIGGWAMDMTANRKSSSVRVQIKSDGAIIWDGQTDGLRTDVNAAYSTTGNHGFTISTPDSVKNGVAHSIVVLAQDLDTSGWKELNGSPKSLTCVPPPVFCTGTLSVTTDKPGTNYAITWWDGTTKIKSQNYSDTVDCGTYSIMPTNVSGYSWTLTPNSPQYLDKNKIIYFDIKYKAGGEDANTVSATCNVNIQTPTPTPTPNPNNPSVSVTEPNYCVSGPGGTVSWTYSDPNNSPQSAYQVQVNDNNLFSEPQSADSGKVSSGGGSYTIPTGQLVFNTTYRARVRVWNSLGGVSDWTVSSTWKTPIYAYPQAAFTWSPNKPGQNVPVQFTDQTVFGGGNANNRSWSWTFGDGSGLSTQQNPSHTYITTGSYTITERATDAANQTCSIQNSINIQKPIPIIKEVAPR